MECEKCRDQIEPGDEKEWHGRILCEDCYMDVLSPARTCDPWAVHSAKSLQKEGGPMPVNPIQARILTYLQESGGAEFPWIVERLQIKPSDLERELAALRHMEKIRGELREGKKIIRLW
ncbi:MAG: hypothetical protein V2B13_08520 [Pseudomonadota bacterium]